MNRIICPSCKNPNNISNTHCSVCGLELGKSQSNIEKKRCQVCGEMNSKDAIYCTSCGKLFPLLSIGFSAQNDSEVLINEITKKCKCTNCGSLEEGERKKGLCQKCRRGYIAVRIVTIIFGAMLEAIILTTLKSNGILLGGIPAGLLAGLICYFSISIPRWKYSTNNAVDYTYCPPINSVNTDIKKGDEEYTMIIVLDSSNSVCQKNLSDLYQTKEKRIVKTKKENNEKYILINDSLIGRIFPKDNELLKKKKM